MKRQHQEQKQIAIADLYPDLSPQQQAEVEETLHGYLRIVWQIYERLEREGKLDQILGQIRKQRQEGRGREVPPSAKT